MITDQTRRRRRGRAIRRRRRLVQARGPEPAYFIAAWDRIRAAARPAIEFLLVAMARVTPHPHPPRAGARRQLLEHGRAPRKGRR